MLSRKDITRYSEIIKKHFGMAPVAIHPSKLSSLRYKRAVVLLDNSDDAIALGYPLEHTFKNDPTAFAPFLLEEDEEAAFESYDAFELDRDEQYDDLDGDFEKAFSGDEDDYDELWWFTRDAVEYRKFYYITDKLEIPVDIEELI